MDESNHVAGDAKGKTVDDGGPAFPCDVEIGRVVEFDGRLDQNVSRQLLEKRSGMTLRDYFAAKALPVVMGDLRECDAYVWHEEVARRVYSVADAMIAARNACEGIPTEATERGLIGELLAACRAARSTLVNAISANVTLPNFDPSEHVTVKALDAAIAKAAGRSL